MNKQIKPVLFSGYYGMSNIGDDVFCTVTEWGARKYWGSKSSDFLTPIVPRLLGEGRPVLLQKQLVKGQRAIESSVQLMLHDWLVFSGGSLFHSRIPKFSPKGIAQKMSRAGHLKIGAIGVSLGPFVDSTAEKHNIEFLRHLSFLVVRDKKSFAMASEMDLPYQPIEGRDLAFLMNGVYGPPACKAKLDRKQGQKVIGVSACWFERFVQGDEGNEKRRIEAFTETLKDISLNANIKLRFFIINNHPALGDSELTQSILSKVEPYCDVELVPYCDDSGAVWGKIAECDIMLTIRLHGAILAAAARVPFILIEYHRKCTDFLCDIGWPKKYLIGDIDLGPDQLTTALRNLMNEDKQDLFDGIDYAETLAELNFTAVSQWFR